MSARPPAGLCDSCVHQRVVRNTRGSAFSLCARARRDPAYPKYPRLPVTACAGHEAHGGAIHDGDPRAGRSGARRALG